MTWTRKQWDKSRRPVHYLLGTPYTVMSYHWSEETSVVKFGIYRDGVQIGMAKTLREAKQTVERLAEVRP